MRKSLWNFPHKTRLFSRFPAKIIKKSMENNESENLTEIAESIFNFLWIFWENWESIFSTVDFLYMSAVNK
jgi:hypothetical protein